MCACRSRIRAPPVFDTILPDFNWSPVSKYHFVGPTGRGNGQLSFGVTTGYRRGGRPRAPDANLGQTRYLKPQLVTCRPAADRCRRLGLRSRSGIAGVPTTGPRPGYNERETLSRRAPKHCSNVSLGDRIGSGIDTAAARSSRRRVLSGRSQNAGRLAAQLRFRQKGLETSRWEY